MQRVHLVLLVLSIVGVAVAGVGMTAADGTVDDDVSNSLTLENTTGGPTVYVGSQNGSVYALDTGEDDLEERWEFQTDGGISTAPIVADGTVYVGSSNTSTGTLYALNASTGALEWEVGGFYQPVGDNVPASPTIVDDVVYIGSPNGHASGTVRALDTETGDEVWNSSDIGQVYTSPNVVEGTVYVGGDAGLDNRSLYALDAETGDIEWEYDEVYDVGSSPTWDNGTVYVGEGTAGAEDKYLHAVDADTGTQQWTFDMAVDNQSPTVSDGTVYIADSALYAVDAETGEKEWSREPGDAGESFGSPTIYDGTVYAGTDEGHGSGQNLYAVDAVTGDLVWVNNQLDGDLDRTPTGHDGVVYAGAGSSDGYLYGVAADTGETLFTFNTSGTATDSAELGAPTVAETPGEDSIGTRIKQGVLGHTEAFPHTSNIVGVVTDANGDLLEDATVDLFEWSRTVSTGSDGTYHLSVDGGTYTLESTAFGYESETETVTLSEEETVEQNFSLEEAADVAVLDDQPGNVSAGEEIETELDVINTDTVTVENLGTATGVDLSVDGESADFGESVSVDDGAVDVTVETSENTTGTVELEHTVAGVGEETTVATGSTDVSSHLVRIGIVEDDEEWGSEWVDAIEDELPPLSDGDYDVEAVTSDDILPDVDAYDGYYVHSLDAENEESWFNATEAVATVYSMHGVGSPNTLEQRSDTIGDPESVTTALNIYTWYVEDEHSIFDGVADPGDEIDTRDDSGPGGYYTTTESDLLAGVGLDDEDGGVGLDYDRQDVLLAPIGATDDFEPGDHTDDALDILGNAVAYFAHDAGVEGEVADTDGETLQNATVDVTDEIAHTTTDDDGNYQLPLEPDTYTLEASAFGYESTTETVTVTDGETVEQEFTLDDVVDVTVLEDQDDQQSTGSPVETVLEVANTDTVTVENVGSLTTGLDLSVDGEPVDFGEEVSVDDGIVDVVVETENGTDGTVELEHTVAGVGGEKTVTTGPTTVFDDHVSVGVVDDFSDAGGQQWVDALDDTLEDRFEVEHVTSDDALDDLDKYDVYFVHEFHHDSDVSTWFDETDDVGTVYTAQRLGPDTLGERSDTIGDPDEVKSDSGLVSWTLTTDHPIFTDAGEQGDEILVHTNDNEYGASFVGTDGDVLAEAEDGNDAIAIDEAREDILLTTLGHRVTRVGVSDHTDEAVTILANSLQYLADDRPGTVEGNVTDEDGDPVENVTVDIVDELQQTTTDADGSYELTVGSGEHTLEASAFGYNTAAETVTVSEDETVEQNFELDDAPDVSVLDDQPSTHTAGDDFGLALEAANADTLTVENVGTLTTGLNLSVDDEDVDFGENVSVDEGVVNVTVTTSANATGTVELEHTLVGLGDTVEVTTGPTDVIENLVRVGVVEDDESESWGEDWAAELESRLADVAASDELATLAWTPDSETVYEAEHVRSGDALADLESYDGYFVHGLNESNEQEWFNETDDVGTVYTAQLHGPETLGQRSDVLGDPDDVTRDNGLGVWHVEEEHPLFAGVASPGEAVDVFNTIHITVGASFTGTDAEVLADADDGNNAIAVDDDNADVFLTSVGSGDHEYRSGPSVDDHTEDALDVLANAVVYSVNYGAGVEGEVTDEDGNAVEGATVDVLDESDDTVTDADGEYELLVEPGTHTLEASLFGFETVSETVTVSEDEVVEQDFELAERVDADVLEGQPTRVQAGEEFELLLEVINADALAVENVGNLTAGLNLSVDGEDADFGESVPVDDGDVEVTVETSENTTGTVELEHTVEGAGDDTEMTTGSTDVFEELYTIGVVEDDFHDRGDAWAVALADELDGPYEVEHITSDDVLSDDSVNAPEDAYDTYFVHGLDDDNEAAWFDETDGVSTVYTARLSGPETLVQRSETVGDPGLVTETTGLTNWHVTESHPIFEGVGDPGDEVTVYEDDLITSGASFAATSADVVAEADDGDHAIAVDEFRQDVLLTTLGSSALVEPANHTDDAMAILANAVTHFVDTADSTVEGTVTSAEGEPIADATVEVVGESKQVSTEEDGTYEISMGSGEYSLELTAEGFENATEMVPVAVESTVEQAFELAPEHDVGDVQETGEVTIVDAVFIQQHLANMEPEPFDPTIADVERTGEVTIVDAVLIQQYLANLIDPGSAEIASVDTPETVDSDSMDVTVTIDNPGGMGVLQNVEHRIAKDEDDLGKHATRAIDVVDLAPESNTELTVTVDTATLTPGTYYYEVVTDDDSEVVTIEVDDDSSASQSTSVSGEPIAPVAD